MKWQPTWSFASQRNDFMPIVVGCLILLMSAPAFVMVVAAPDRNSGVIGIPLACVLGAGIFVGLVFLIMGIRLCSDPGSLGYRITHPRIGPLPMFRR